MYQIKNHRFEYLDWNTRDDWSRLSSEYASESPSSNAGAIKLIEAADEVIINVFADAHMTGGLFKYWYWFKHNDEFRVLHTTKNPLIFILNATQHMWHSQYYKDGYIQSEQSFKEEMMISNLNKII